jgi:hypothetical protein
LLRLSPFSRLDIPSSHALPLTALLLNVTARYDDHPSNEAVTSVLKALVGVSEDGKIAEKWRKWILDELTRSSGRSVVSRLLMKWRTVSESLDASICSSTAPSNFFILNLHATSLISSQADTLPPSDAFGPSIYTLALSVDAILEPSNRAKISIERAAIKRTRKLFRINPSLITPTLDLLTSSSSSATTSPALPSSTKLLPLLGLVVDVCLHLRGKGENEKGQIGGVGHGYVESVKAGILESWKAAVLGGNGPVGKHVLSALTGFFSRFFTSDDFDVVLPSIEKSLVRTPDLAFQSLTSLLSSTSLPRSTFLPKLLPHALSNFKSAKADVRSQALSFFMLLFAAPAQSAEDKETKGKVMDELLSVLKTGKSVSADHRIALFSAIAALETDDAYSTKVATVLPPLISKETTSEPALEALLRALIDHLAHSLITNSTIPPASLTAITKELASPKASARVPVVRLVGSTLREIGRVEEGKGWTAEANKFAESVAKPLADVSLKNVSNGSLTAVAGVGEGFVAAAALLGPLSKCGSKAVGTLLASNPILQSIASTTPKPSFVLWDKAQRKASTVWEEHAILHSLAAVVDKFEDKLVGKDDSLR